ncbi:DUF4258 domain-containing protein [Paenibacillus sp. ISL-20]|uniref:DUF4258 domain-containing protein n=1 Tax=Paenibacillus sp. ISL-20 TaxID=2819163 RepID=UPI001BE6B14A|nr:DUF4258 domain-containing protein [Paenibacillus sp. ISL-20]MBT2759874.1 DUF4258 domain-containing protein [Paenibacillus sp. ISL-20]
MNNDEVISLIKTLAEEDNYYLRKHARERMTQRNITTDDVKDIMVNVKRILRTDTDNEDGITSYKIEGGAHDHRLAIKFDEEQAIIIITVMDKR